MENNNNNDAVKDSSGIMLQKDSIILFPTFFIISGYTLSLTRISQNRIQYHQLLSVT